MLEKRNRFLSARVTVSKWEKHCLKEKFYVDKFEEVDKTFSTAVANGATPVLESTTEPWGQRTCYIADPEGNLIEIGSWNKPFEIKDK